MGWLGERALQGEEVKLLRVRKVVKVVLAMEAGLLQRKRKAGQVLGQAGKKKWLYACIFV